MWVQTTSGGSNVGRDSRFFWLLMRRYGRKKTQFTEPGVGGITVFSSLTVRDLIKFCEIQPLS